MNEYLITCRCVLTVTAASEEDAREQVENAPEEADFIVCDEILECVENDE